MASSANFLGLASAQPPPDVPSDPNIDAKLSNYLRQFALWCRRGFQTKLDVQTAAPGILLMSPNNDVYRISVDNNGRLVSTPIALSSGAPGTPVVTFAPIVIYGASSVPNPAATGSTTYVMMGIGLMMTPIYASAAQITADAQVNNTVNGAETDVVVCYGTGPAPAWGVAQTGTIATQPARYRSSSVNSFTPFSLTALLTGLISGTTYWIDLAVKVTSGSGFVTELNMNVHGLA